MCGVDGWGVCEVCVGVWVCVFVGERGNLSEINMRVDTTTLGDDHF